MYGSDGIDSREARDIARDAVDTHGVRMFWTLLFAVLCTGIAVGLALCNLRDALWGIGLYTRRAAVERAR